MGGWTAVYPKDISLIVSVREWEPDACAATTWTAAAATGSN